MLLKQIEMQEKFEMIKEEKMKTIKELKKFNKNVKTTYWLAYEKALQDVVGLIDKLPSTSTRELYGEEIRVINKEELKAMIEGWF